jgi:cytochrome bd-type quinol oxidase subunit 2
MTSSAWAISGVSALIALIAVKLSHLQALVLFALVISVAFGFLGRRQPKERVKYILWTLLLFLLVGVGIGWAMYPFSR